jgi:hypothetical protein
MVGECLGNVWGMFGGRLGDVREGVGG